MLECQSACVKFSTVTIYDLETSTPAQLDTLSFGVIGLSAAGLVEIYNERESKLAGLSPSMVMGANFFLTIAQCMNNFMVAQRFLDEPELDATIDFVLTFRMRPTPVQLRMLQSASARRHYVLIAR